MLIAAYRNTERGIHAARKNHVVLDVVPPVRMHRIKPDNSLVSIFATKFEAFTIAVNAELAVRCRQDKHMRYRARFERIVVRFCRVFDVDVMEIISDRRGLRTVHARQAIYYWAWRITPLSAVQIGKRLGGRDHTTVLAGVSAYQRKRAQMGRHLRELRRGGK